MKKTVLITGGAGFIGSHIARKLISQDFKVIIVDNLRTGKIQNVPKEAIFYNVDITDFAAVKDVFERETPSIISHHAAQAQVRASVANPQRDAQINILGLLNILEAVKNQSNIHILFASSGGAIYDASKLQPVSERMRLNPTSPYGSSKVSSEVYLKMYSQLYGIHTTILRYANVYGPGQSPEGEAGVIALFSKKLLSGQVPHIYGSGNHIRDYIFIDDVVAANVTCIEKNIFGIFNIGTGIETTTLKIFSSIASQLHSEVQPIFAPAQPGEQTYNCLQTVKAFKRFGWQAQVNLEEGIQKTILWHKNA